VTLPVPRGVQANAAPPGECDEKRVITLSYTSRLSLAVLVRLLLPDSVTFVDYFSSSRLPTQQILSDISRTAPICFDYFILTGLWVFRSIF